MRTLAASQRFKNTPAGMIPVDWRSFPLRDIILTMTSGVSVNGDDAHISNGDVGVLKVSAVSNGRFIPDEHKRVVEKDRLRVSTPVSAGTVLVSRSNTESLVGEAAFIEADQPNLFLSDKLWELRVDPEQIDSRWLAYLLNSPPFRAEVSRRCSGTSGSMKNISQPSYTSIAVPVPPLREQRAIAERLAEWDAGIRLSETLLVEQTAHKRGLMQQLLTGKRRFKNFGGKRWVSLRIGDLLHAEDRYAKFSDDTLFRLASIRRRSGGLFAREPLYGHQIKTKVLKAIRAGDFIISRMQVLHGALGSVPPEFDGFFVSDSYDVLVPRDLGQLDMGFFNYLSQRPEIYRLALISSHGVHIEKMTFVLDDFLHEKVQIPPTIEEQHRIAAALKACDDEISLLKNQTEALCEQKRGLMEKVLTGQIRLRAASN